MTVFERALLRYAEDIGIEAFKERFREVNQEVLDGVTVTSVSFGDGAGSGQSNRKPQELLASMEKVLSHMEGKPLHSEVRGRLDRSFLSV